MNCKKCGNEMKEETLFTTVVYSCDCNDNWKTANELKLLLNINHFPIKLNFKDEDGRQGSVFITDIEYFDRCPQYRKFKLEKNYYGNHDIY